MFSTNLTCKCMVHPLSTLKLQNWFQFQIGAFAAPDKIHWAPGLPKTRSGKIMRRILRKIASRQLNELGDTSTLADPNVVDELIKLTDSQNLQLLKCKKSTGGNCKLSLRLSSEIGKLEKWKRASFLVVVILFSVLLNLDCCRCSENIIQAGFLSPDSVRAFHDQNVQLWISGTVPTRFSCGNNGHGEQQQT